MHWTVGYAGVCVCVAAGYVNFFFSILFLPLVFMASIRRKRVRITSDFCIIIRVSHS